MIESMPSPDTQHDVDFLVKDSNGFTDSGGWGYAVFDEFQQHRAGTQPARFTWGTRSRLERSRSQRQTLRVRGRYLVTANERA
jgi:hypothetical protein